MNLLKYVSDFVDKENLVDVNLGPLGDNALDDFNTFFFLHS